MIGKHSLSEESDGGEDGDTSPNSTGAKRRKRDHLSVPSQMRALLRVRPSTFFYLYGVTPDRFAKLFDTLLENSESFFRQSPYKDVLLHATARMLFSLRTLLHGESVMGKSETEYGISLDEAKESFRQFVREFIETYSNPKLRNLYLECSPARAHRERARMKRDEGLDPVSACVVSACWNFRHLGRDYAGFLEAAISKTSRLVLFPFIRIIDISTTERLVGAEYNILHFAKLSVIGDQPVALLVPSSYPCNSCFVQPVKKPRTKNEKAFDSKHNQLIHEAQQVLLGDFLGRYQSFLAFPFDWISLDETSKVLTCCCILFNMAQEDFEESSLHKDFQPVPYYDQGFLLSITPRCIMVPEEIQVFNNVRDHAKMRRSIEENLATFLRTT